jgi:fermentation-respiration switch protein FrsA (DUF1100 family)
MAGPLIAVDICNTLADVNSQISEIAYGRKQRDHYGLEDLGYPQPERFFEEHPEVFSRASPVPDALKVMRELAKTFRIAYVSARPTWAMQRTMEWLQIHQLPPGPLFLTRDKAAVIRKLRPLLAIEDSPEETARITPICPVLVIGQPYNRESSGWSQILTILTAL